MGVLSVGQVQNCTVPTGWKYDYPSGNIVISPQDVWCVKADGCVILFGSELEALRWIVRNGNTGVAFRAKFGERIEMV